MLRDSLKEKNYTTTSVHMTLRTLNISSWIFVTMFTFASIILKIYTDKIMAELRLKTITFPIHPVFFAIFAMYIYYILIGVIANIFCESKGKNTKLKFIEKIKMPTCTCIEGLKVNQLITIYIVPLCVVFLVCPIFSSLTGEMMFVLMAFFCAILIAPDASLLLYILRLNKRKKPDYVVVEDHLSSIILFTSSNSPTSVNPKKKGKNK